KTNNVHLKIVNERQTRHGDYRKGFSGKHEITVNSNLNKYRFLITLVHEIAHLVAFEKHGRLIKPHGVEWKMTFQRLMVPFIRPEIFPHSVLSLVANHFRNPSASSDTDARLAFALKQFDERKPDVHFVHEVPSGSLFRIKNGRVFQKKGLRVKRYECLEVKTGKLFLFNANAEVEIIPG
ncbi:MAG TPA: SprT-like domain-containing protein, partial [Flavobacterium sp.]|nr:SprT-like domain-containing protein [Flavobacterium sp.]